MPDTFNLSDVFISYSRRDKDFARRLFDKLKSESREVWADWEDIPATADWWAEVQAGIEGADTFVFVISPDSVISDVCRREIDHAMKNHKRFVPVLYREIVEDDHKSRMHGAISSHNWIYFRDSDDFESAYRHLIASLETDLNHVRMHTRFLVRAREWDTRQRIPGFLLTGAELKEGQAWLTTNAQVEPIPTPLHNEYISASGSARRRQQMFQIGLIAALLIAIIMAVVAFSQSRIAVSNAAEAVDARQTSDANAGEALLQASTAQAAGATSDANANIAQAAASTATIAQGEALIQANTAVAAQSTSDANADYAAQQAALAVNNAATATIAQGQAINQAETAVAAQSTSDANAIIAQNNAVTATVAQGDALNQAATAEYSGGISRSIALAAQSQLDVNGSSPERSIALALVALRRFPYTQQAERALGIAVQNSRVGEVYYDETGSVNGVVFSPDGTKIATGSEAGILTIWDIVQATDLMSLQATDEDIPIQAIEALAWSPDGRSVATAGGAIDNAVLLWDMDSGEIARQFVGHNATVTSVAFSADGRYLVTTSEDTTAIIWDVQTGEILHTLSAHQDVVTDAAFSPDGRIIATASRDTSIILWNAATGEQIGRLGGNGDLNSHQQAVGSVAFSPNGRQLLTGGDDTRAIIWDVNKGVSIGMPLVGRDRILAARWSPDGNQILTASADGNIRIWQPQELPDKTTVYNVVLEFSAGVIKDAVWSPDGLDVVTAGSDGKVKFWDTTVDRALLTLGESASSNVVFSSDSSQLLGGSEGGEALWDATTGEQLENYVQRGGDVLAVVWSRDGSRYAALQYNGFIQIRAADGNLITTVLGDTTSDTEGALALSSDGMFLAADAADNSISIWNTDSGELINSRFGGGDQIYSAAWSPNGTRLLTSGDTSAFIWDPTSSYAPPLVLTGHTDTVSSVAWSPDGTRVMTGSLDGTAIIWDAATGEILTTLSGHTGPIQGVDWSPDGKRVVTASRDRTARIWDAATGTEMFTLFGNSTGPLFSVDWSPDGMQVVTTSDNGQVQVWEVWQTLNDLLTYAEECCFIPDLTLGEQQQFGIGSGN